jgi:DNA polymerase-3 subunit epsilon
MNYVVLDLETANADCASICQIGFVAVEAGRVLETGVHLVDPQAPFDPWNVRIHGIEASRVQGSPTWPELHADLAQRLKGRVVVTHGPFDRVAMTRACEKHGLARVEALWLDNQRVVRRTWTQFARRGYALDNLARHFGIPLRHHDALEDAVATERIFRRALEDSRMTARQWWQAMEPPAGRASRPTEQASE